MHLQPVKSLDCTKCAALILPTFNLACEIEVIKLNYAAKTYQIRVEQDLVD